MSAIFAGSVLWEHLLPSVGRVFFALGLSALIAFPLGYLAAGRKLSSLATASSISLVRYLPPTAFIGILVVTFGIGSEASIALIFIGITPYMAVMAADTFRSAPTDLSNVAKVFGASRLQRFTLIEWPWSIPRLVEVIKVNVGAAWTLLVVAEIIAGNNGIGYLIARAQRFLEIQQLYALILTCGICGILMDRIFEAISRYLGRWTDANVAPNR